MLATVLLLHGTINLSATSTAVLGLIVIPIYGVMAALVGWIVGMITARVVASAHLRRRLAFVCLIVGSLAATGYVVYATHVTAWREARFPSVSVDTLPISKRDLSGCCPPGTIVRLRIGNFDTDPDPEIVVLGPRWVALLEADTYRQTQLLDLMKAQCHHVCLGMYPDLVPDGTGGFVIVSANGLVDQNGRLRWAFGGHFVDSIVPLRTPGDSRPSIFVSSRGDRLERRDLDGKELWSVALSASRIGKYSGPDGQGVLAALSTASPNHNMALLIDQDGKTIKQLAPPIWASEVQEISWPSPSHLLVGNAGKFLILDHQGTVVFQHSLEALSFDPYHGPEGAAVRLAPSSPPYLAVVSHGSSGYPRSVLMIFNPAGEVLWQEAMPKVRSLLAVETGDGLEALLVGGQVGLTEYRLVPAAARTSN